MISQFVSIVKFLNPFLKSFVYKHKTLVFYLYSPPKNIKNSENVGV